jgi:hypothetical protein
MPNLGAADARVLVWMMAAMKYGRVSARINGLAASGSHPRAEQRGSKVVGALEKYMRRRCSSGLG